MPISTCYKTGYYVGSVLARQFKGHRPNQEREWHQKTCWSKQPSSRKLGCLLEKRPQQRRTFQISCTAVCKLWTVRTKRFRQPWTARCCAAYPEILMACLPVHMKRLTQGCYYTQQIVHNTVTEKSCCELWTLMWLYYQLTSLMIWPSTKCKYHLVWVNHGDTSQFKN